MSDSWHLQRRIPSHRQDSRSKHGSSFDMWKPYSRWKILLFFQKFLDCHVLILQDVVECRESKQIKNVIDFIIHVGEFDISSNLPDILYIRHEDSEACTCDIIESVKVNDDVRFFVLNQLQECLFQLRCGMCIQFSVKIYNLKPSVCSLFYFETFHRY